MSLTFVVLEVYFWALDLDLAPAFFLNSLNLLRSAGHSIVGLMHKPLPTFSYSPCLQNHEKSLEQNVE